METADQYSMASASTLSYASPAIGLLSPSAGQDTFQDPDRPVVVTVSGIEFALMATNVEIGIAFGNVADGSLLPLIPVIARSPSVAEVTSPGWVKPATPMPSNVSFVLVR